MSQEPLGAKVVNRTPLFYTFGNHMHWVDMEWLWGYDALPGSVRDMLALCEAAGVKGNVNFDGVGYEKLAAEAPDTFAALREAVRRGQIEIVGASYAQPYGQFHGGESNIRQRVFGVRAVERLFGVRPKTFWEEEFDFFPQLPQMLRGAGFEFASLFFQWTWHTPHIPLEEASAMWWAGLDGSRLLAAPRNELNLHQWPEDFDGLLDRLDDVQLDGGPRLLLQWLELMPSPDWMCRSEVLLHRLRELMSDPRFDVQTVTLGEFLERARPQTISVRGYALNEVFHGMSLGKNGDRMRRLSREVETRLLAAESLSAMLGIFGRPYAQWDVYPTWELEEAWRELMIAQHHDNDECEGLCGHVGRASYARAEALASSVLGNATQLLRSRAPGPLAVNALGWPRDIVVGEAASGALAIARDVPAFGFVALDAARVERPTPVAVVEAAQARVLRRDGFSATIDRATGRVVRIACETEREAIELDVSIGELTMGLNHESRALTPTVTLNGPRARAESASEGARVDIALAPDCDALDIRISLSVTPDGGMNAAVQLSYEMGFAHSLIHDHPYGVSAIEPSGAFRRKYPSGDWMTSEQWYEDVHSPFTALTFLDFDAGDRGLLLLHDGNQQFFKRGSRVAQILNMRDPWDGDRFESRTSAHLRLIPHGPLTHLQRWKLAQEFLAARIASAGEHVGREGAQPDLPPRFTAAVCDSDACAITAFFREQHNPHVPFAYPYVMRLVEFNGAATTARVVLPGRAARVLKTNLLGEVEVELAPSPADAPIGRTGLTEWSAVDVPMRPHEIATLTADLELGRKHTRDLDARRGVWARAHRTT